ncbi:MAG TPA: DUF4136 domain-containing protein [Chryseosolibacter sp.]
MNKAIFISFLLLLTRCSPEISVYSDYDPDYDVRQYQTFGWMAKADIEAGQNPIYYNELNDKRIRSAVNTELTTRGYQLTETQPQLLIHYHIIVDDRTVIATDPYGAYYGPYWMRMQTNVYPYREGTLIIDLMSGETGNLIWRGWAFSAIQSTYTAEQADRVVKAAVTKIFRKFQKSSLAGPGVVVQ